MSKHFWRVLALGLCLGFYSVGVMAEEGGLNQYLPKVDLRLGGVYGPIDTEDNVLNIANKIMPMGQEVTVEELVAGIVLKNPEAFVAGDPKTLKRGVFLKLPTLDDLKPTAKVGVPPEPPKVGVPPEPPKVGVPPELPKVGVPTVPPTEPVGVPPPEPVGEPVGVPPVPKAPKTSPVTDLMMGDS